MPRPSNIPPLGDESDSDETFQSPEKELGQTDYALNYSETRIVNPFGPSTSRDALTRMKKQPTARKRTGGGGNSVQTRSSSVAQSESAHRRKKNKPVHRSMRVIKEIKYLMGTVHTLIPRLSFGRVVREIMQNCIHGDILRITRTALEALHESTELYLTQQLQDAYTLTLHRGRVTLSVKDMELLRFLRGRI